MISPSEIIRTLVENLGLDAVVGPASDDAQQAGVVSIMDSGMPVIELYTPTVWVRPQFRCVAGTLDRADEMARTLQLGLPSGRQVVTQADGDSYLVHRINMDGGPSMHFDSTETWETLLFASVLFGTTPVETA